MTVHQSRDAFAAAVTKTGFLRFLWQPGHDNWLVDTRAAAFLPASTNAPSRHLDQRLETEPRRPGRHRHRPHVR